MTVRLPRATVTEPHDPLEVGVEVDIVGLHFRRGAGTDMAIVIDPGDGDRIAIPLTKLEWDDDPERTFTEE